MARPKKTQSDEVVNEVLDSVNNKPEKKEKKYEFISTGSTLFNLALTDRIDGGFPLGDMANFVGDSDTGKSLVGLSMMAHAVRDSRFDDYQFIYYAIETGLYFPTEKMFGKHLKRIKIIQKSPYTIQEWKTHILKTLQKPTIVVLDSADALTTEEEMKLAIGDKERKEGYINQIKPKVFSASLSPIVGTLNSTGSFLLVISQTRQNIGVSFGPAKRRAAGEALKFYSTCEAWASKISQIMKRVRGEEVKIGETIKVRVPRTRITGKSRDIIFHILDEIGIDDVGSMIDWLVKWNFWGILKSKKEDNDADGESKENKRDKKAKETIDTGNDFENLTRNELIKHIEDNNLESKLRTIVQESWNELESEISSQRKSPYAE